MNDDNDMLSQEEIDALMENNSESSSADLTDEEIDILGEVGNISMGSAATALYSLLDQEVNITTPRVEVVNFGDLSEEYNRPCVLVKVNYIEGLEGFNILIIDDKDAKIIADLMMGGDGTNEEIELDEIHLSAVGEAMNQMMGSSSTAMSSIIDEVVNISPPEPEYLQLDDVIENEPDYFDGEDTVVSVSFQLKIGDLIDSSFKQILPIDFTRQLIKRLSSDDNGLTAKESESDGVGSQDVTPAEKEETVSASSQSGKKEMTAGTESSQKQAAASAETAASAAASANQGAGQTSDTQPSPPAGSKNVQKEGVGVQSAQFPNFDKNTSQPQPQNMELIKDVPLEVTVRLGKSRMTIKEILDLGEGSIIELDKLAGEPVDLLVNGKLVAKGEVVVIDENFGFRVKDIIKPMDRLNNL